MNIAILLIPAPLLTMVGLVSAGFCIGFDRKMIRWASWSGLILLGLIAWGFM